MTRAGDIVEGIDVYDFNLTKGLENMGILDEGKKKENTTCNCSILTVNIEVGNRKRM